TTADDEEGLVGIELDPGFASNHFVYVCYTASQPVRHQRIGRLTAAGDTAVPGSLQTLFDLDPNGAHFHLGGALRFSSDGRLYCSTGDNGSGFAAGSLGSTHGKLLRLNADGSIPADNPFVGVAT